VLHDVELAVRSGFSFAAREFGQPVFLSEVITAIQNVPGVLNLRITRLQYTDVPEASPSVMAWLPAGVPGQDAGGIPVPAGLLTLDPAPFPVEVLE
jgi:hypothetical protein